MSLLQQQTEELRQLRLENATLRAQLQGVQVHQPYHAPPLSQPSLAPCQASTVPEGALASSIIPRDEVVTVTEDVTMTPPKLTHPSEKGISSPDPKRLRALVDSGANDV